MRGNRLNLQALFLWFSYLTRIRGFESFFCLCFYKLCLIILVLTNHIELYHHASISYFSSYTHSESDIPIFWYPTLNEYIHKAPSTWPGILFLSVYAQHYVQGHTQGTHKVMLPRHCILLFACIYKHQQTELCCHILYPIVCLIILVFKVSLCFNISTRSII